MLNLKKLYFTNLQKFPLKSRQEILFANADARGSRNKAGRSQSAGFNSSGTQKKGNKEFLADSKEQQVLVLATESNRKGFKSVLIVDIVFKSSVFLEDLFVRYVSL